MNKYKKDLNCQLYKNKIDLKLECNSPTQLPLIQRA